jgi:2',3'-cyclic-nucleotide 2'-phosphodiesterase (5'-nucleotidase family)
VLRASTIGPRHPVLARAIALIVGGHSHMPVVERVGTTLVRSSPDAVARPLARPRRRPRPRGLEGDRREGLIPVDPRSAPEDLDVTAVMERYGKDIDTKLNEVVGELAAPARRDDGTAGNCGHSP